MKDLNNFRELSEKETIGVSGGILPVILRIVLPTVANMIVYSFHKHNNKEPITVKGLAIAGGAGLVTGEIVGNIVWTPDAAAINGSENLIAQ